MSRSTSEVSIVTVNWNGREHLARLLPSLAELSAGEIIVVDNGSSDGSQDLVRHQFPQVKLLQNEVNQGFCQPNNLAAEHASGRCLAFINNDMRADGKWLQNALPLLEGDTCCVASRILDWEGKRIDFNGSSLQYLGYAVQRDIGELVENVSHEKHILFPCGGAMLIDRQVFLAAGGFDEDYFAIFEDVDLGWRLWLAGYRVAFAPESFVYHRGHSTFKQHEDEKMRYLMHRNALLTVIKNYEEEAFRKILSLAFIMAVKRAVLFSGVEKESFYLWGKTRQRLEAGDLAARLHFMDALNHLVAVDDVLESLPRLLEKRAKIQALRKRSDAEILQLFVDPVRGIFEHPQYRSQEAEYINRLDLGPLIDHLKPGDYARTLPPFLESKIKDLKNELLAREWIRTQNGLHPQMRSGSRFGKFVLSWKYEGPGAAVRRALRALK